MWKDFVATHFCLCHQVYYKKLHFLEQKYSYCKELFSNWYSFLAAVCEMCTFRACLDKFLAGKHKFPMFATHP